MPETYMNVTADRLLELGLAALAGSLPLRTLGPRQADD
jgi:hypothetical protein